MNEAKSPRRRPTWRVAPAPQRRSSEWWDYARASRAAPDAMRPLLVDMPPDEIRVSKTEAKEIALWAAGLPEWDARELGLPVVLVIEPIGK